MKNIIFLFGSIIVLVVCSCVNQNDFQDSTRFDISPADSLNAFGSDPVFSPDGKGIVYSGRQEESKTTQLYIRKLDQVSAVAIPGSERASNPFFSPDGNWVGFTSLDGELKKIEYTGGVPITIFEQSIWRQNRCCWGPNGILVPLEDGRLVEVASDGTDIRTIVPRNVDYKQFPCRWFDVLPDGQSALCTVWSGTLRDARIGIINLITGDVEILLAEGTSPLYSISGHIVYAQKDGTLLASPFNVDRQKVTGPAVQLGIKVQVIADGRASFSLSDNGSIVYIPRTDIHTNLVSIDCQGKEQVLIAESGSCRTPRFSPDGKYISMTNTKEGAIDIWVYNTENGALSRLTSRGSNMNPIWHPDGKRITFDSNISGDYDLHSITIATKDNPQPILTMDGLQYNGCWSPNGQNLLYIDVYLDEYNIWLLPITGNKKPTPVLQSEFNEKHPAISPDGRFLAYASDETGRFEVYVRTFPDLSLGIWQVSGDGGFGPLWDQNGHHLYYRGNGMFHSVEIQTSPNFKVGNRALLFKDDYATWFRYRMYDVSPDGQQFVAAKRDQTVQPRMLVAVKLFEELNGKVPTED